MSPTDNDESFDLVGADAPEGQSEHITGLFTRAPATNSVEFELLAMEMADDALGKNNEPIFIESEDAAELPSRPEPTLSDVIRNRIFAIWRDRRALARSIPDCKWPVYRVAAEKEGLGASADTTLAELRSMLRRLEQ